MKFKAKQAREAHRNVAIFLLIFIGVHFATHFVSLTGVETHTRALGWARLIYQFPLIEIALVTALAMQVLLGFRLLAAIRKRSRKDAWHWVQFISACYLAYFIVQHTAAALITRLGFGLDTNFYWAAGTLALEADQLRLCALLCARRERYRCASDRGAALSQDAQMARPCIAARPDHGERLYHGLWRGV